MTTLDAGEWTRRATALLSAVLVVDVTLVITNLAGGPAFLDLDAENNFPTWYSSAKLMSTALAALGLARLPAGRGSTRRRRLRWSLVAVLFAALSIDETAAWHERLATAVFSSDAAAGLRGRLLGGDPGKDALLWPVLFAPVVLGLLYFLAAVLWTELRRDRLSRILGLAGCLLLLSAVGLESLAALGSPPIEVWGTAEVARYRLLVLLEESSEVAAATALLAALLRHLARARNLGREPSRRLAAESLASREEATKPRSLGA